MIPAGGAGAIPEKVCLGVARMIPAGATGAIPAGAARTIPEGGAAIGA